MDIKKTQRRLTSVCGFSRSMYKSIEDTPASWSSWFNISDENISQALPDEPGVYEIQTDFEINRVKGNSEIVYIGSAVDSLNKRLCSKMFKNCINLDRVSKWLFSHSHSLEFRYMVTTTYDAKYHEALLLWEYEHSHWELPPGNDKLERAAIIDHIMQHYYANIERFMKQHESVDKLLRDLIGQKKSNKEIADLFCVPEYIIENFRVYFLE